MSWRLTAALSRLPSCCAVCHAWPARPVCEPCTARFAEPRTRCLGCALGLRDGQALCGACLVDPPPLDACHAALDYAYPWSALVARFKFGDQPGWARPLSQLMRRSRALAQALDQADAVVPMPLAPRRLAGRGFNQALELARWLAPERLENHLLLRVRETHAQATLGLAERRDNVAGAFMVDPLVAHRASGRHVAIVDDVMTSGATLHAAARALREAGAMRVTALVLARTPAPG
jgi:ComF family protein